ncbi:MAG: acyltransferase [Pseudomonadota bacterium]|nr:acyltransferase [Pseudomonadota bacterium]
MKYRAEIDGLRAIAVIPVILFHAGFESFSGGFIGVDIFFVISGYLITSILIEDIKANNFSIIRFYEKRARRILPALFFIILLCIPFSWLWMLPNQMKEFGQSLIAVSLFSSNFLFWKQSDYFSAATDEKPLLHTWSLAVEEQYYLFFPILLLLAWSLGKKNLLFIIIVLSGSSFLLSEWGWRTDSTANFYLAPTRAWELLIGSIIAFFIKEKGVKKSNTLSLVGIIAIVISIFFYNKTLPFPSSYTILPVLGSALIILYGEKGTIVSRILSSKPFISIGLISYSAYLWHQPIFAFTRIKMITEPSLPLMASLSTLSLILAAGTWKYIEKPFRKSTIRTKPFVTLSIIATSSLLIIGYSLHSSDGALDRFRSTPIYKIIKTEEENRKDNRQACNKSDQFPYCVIGDQDNVSIAIVGDSHSSALWAAFSDFGIKNKKGFIGIANAGCPPSIGTYVNPVEKKPCNSINTKNLQYLITDNRIKTVILAARWTLPIEKTRYNNGIGGIEKGDEFWLDTLSDNGEKITNKESKRKQLVLNSYQIFIDKLISSGMQVIVIRPIAEMGFNIPDIYARMLIKNPKQKNITIPYDIYIERNKLVNNSFDSLESIYKEHDLSFINPNIDNCLEKSNICYGVKNGNILYFDDDHVTKLKATRIVKSLISLL